MTKPINKMLDKSKKYITSDLSPDKIYSVCGLEYRQGSDCDKGECRVCNEITGRQIKRPYCVCGLKYHKGIDCDKYKCQVCHEITGRQIND